MWANKQTVIVSIIGVASAVAFGAGWLLVLPPLMAGGGAGLAYALLRWTASNLRRRRRRRPDQPAATPKPLPRQPAKPVDSNDVEGLVKRMLAQQRFTLLLRPQIARGLDERQLARATAALEEAMALVPDGEVVLWAIDEALDDGELEPEEIEACAGRVIRVEPFFLDRYTVTNREFREFVLAGGYGDISLWDERVWSAVLEFVDQTGQSGPRFWKDGTPEPGKEEHPVVGVSWYEANAYARWLGKRLPTDAEWVKAGSWPVNLSANTRVQRRYPWGNTMDRSRANLWGSGPYTTVAVVQFPDGVSVGGVYQLIGNVWEWTRGNLGTGDPTHRDLVAEPPMKSIRGGAFDTYFDNQATCQFQSGETPMARKRNIGFRCAVGICDLVLAPAGEESATTELEEASVEEVQV